MSLASLKFLAVASCAIVFCSTLGARASTVNYGAYIDVRQTFVGGDVVYMTDPNSTITGKARDYFDTGVGTQYKTTDATGKVTIYEGRSWASADLATGKLRGFGYGEAFGGGFEASLTDRVYFDTKGSLEPFKVNFDAYFHGDFSDNAQANFSIYLIGGYSLVGTTALYRDGGTAENPKSVSYINSYESDGAFTVKGSSRFSGYVMVDPRGAFQYGESLPFLGVAMAIGANGSYVNVANTAGLTISSPYSYTSASGVFLTEASDVSTVPVPGALPLLATGLFGFGLVAYRKRLTIRQAVKASAG